MISLSATIRYCAVLICVLFLNTDYTFAQKLPPSGWLYAQGNKIYISNGDQNFGNDKVFAGRGVNIFDSRSFGGGFGELSTGEIKRRIDMLVDDWGANFLRLCLQSGNYTTVVEDPAYLDKIVEIVEYVGTKPGVYVLVSNWWSKNTDELGWPSSKTYEEWYSLAKALANYPQAMFGMINEPKYNFNNDPAINAKLLNRLDSCINTIRLAESHAGVSYQHIITASGTGAYGRYLSYYVNNPVTAYGGTNIAYETHVYDPESRWNENWLDASQTIPVIIGEFGPVSNYMTMDDCIQLMDLADDRQIPYAGWSFHHNSNPSMLVDNSNGSMGEGMDLKPNEWGRVVRDHLRSLKEPGAIYKDNITRITGKWVSYRKGYLFESTRNAFEGSKHYQWNFTVFDWWANCGLNIQRTDFSGYEYLTLACRKTGIANISIRLKDSNGRYTGYLALKGLNSDYKYVHIPLSLATGIDLTSVEMIQFDAGGTRYTSGVFNVDDIKLTTSSANASRFAMDVKEGDLSSDIALEDLSDMDLSDDMQVTMYPNPAKSTMHIEVLEPADIEIVNLSGQTFIKKRNVKISDIDISELTEGIYMVKIKLGEKCITKKLVKY